MASQDEVVVKINHIHDATQPVLNSSNCKQQASDRVFENQQANINFCCQEIQFSFLSHFSDYSDSSDLKIEKR